MLIRFLPLPLRLIRPNNSLSIEGLQRKNCSSLPKLEGKQAHESLSIKGLQRRNRSSLPRWERKQEIFAPQGRLLSVSMMK